MSKIIPGIEGFDHINLSDFSKLYLGRSLSLSFDQNAFTYPNLGEFRSVEGFWYFIATGSKLNDFRSLSSKESRKLFKTTKKYKVKNLLVIVANALYYRIKQDKNLLPIFLKNKLPFELYYEKLNERISPSHSEIIIRSLSIIKDALKKDVEPDFTILKEYKDLPIENIEIIS